MEARLAGSLWLALALAAPGAAFAQDIPAASDPLRIEGEAGHVKFGIEAGIQIVGESNSFWNLPKVFSPGSFYKATLGWGEGYTNPSADVVLRAGSGVELYGGLSAVAAYTLGKDVFAVQDKGRFLLENGYAGLRWAQDDAWRFDVSAGAQPYRIGSGMLIADGAADGFERGALIFGPRQAWKMTGVARIGYGPAQAEAFGLHANDLASNDTGTKIAGVHLTYALSGQNVLGAAYGRVTASTAPYVQAAPAGGGFPAILAGGRDGMEFLQLYGRASPLPAAVPDLWLAADLALQRNGRIDMEAWGGRLEIGYAFAGLSWRPTVTYGYQTFSGDDPATARLERFDPLYYDGSQGGWASGTNGSFVFINSNVNAHRLSLALTVTPRDLVTFRYAHVRANELNSPVQFGQATRLTFTGGIPALATGVTTPHLSDDVLAEYTRVLTPNAYLTAGVGYSHPGRGLKDAAGGRVDAWTGAFANLVVRY
ncbi:MAG: hypothetical protein O9972_16280 [Burkholderiales bacterium]|nr:hypothetical protein [Burkholderiales bacterium]